jgi:hypothetical protein
MALDDSGSFGIEVGLLALRRLVVVDTLRDHYRPRFVIIFPDHQVDSSETWRAVNVERQSSANIVH